MLKLRFYCLVTAFIRHWAVHVGNYPLQAEACNLEADILQEMSKEES